MEQSRIKKLIWVWKQKQKKHTVWQKVIRMRIERFDTQKINGIKKYN